MRLLLPLLLLSACTDDSRTTVWVWDADDGCYAAASDALRTSDLLGPDCNTQDLPAVRADGACVILGVTCIPPGYAPAGASSACDEAHQAWDGGAGRCAVDGDTDA